MQEATDNNSTAVVVKQESTNEMAEVGNLPEEGKEKQSDLQTLIDHQNQIQQWLQMVNNKIFEMESAYFEECVSGNIIKGWDIDGRTLPIHRSRNTIDEKDRVFSFSSHNYWIEKRNTLEASATNDKAVAQTIFVKNNSLKNRKQKKRKSDFDDWNGLEDY